MHMKKQFCLCKQKAQFMFLSKHKGWTIFEGCRHGNWKKVVKKHCAKNRIYAIVYFAYILSIRMNIRPGFFLVGVTSYKPRARFLLFASSQKGNFSTHAWRHKDLKQAQVCGLCGR